MTKANVCTVLDHGYVELIEVWGSEERIIESARMSTNKGFNGWGDAEKPGDEKLLRFLYENKHATPFEFAGAVFEVKAPLMVFREWHRHRTQSYNEMSARYIPLPDENYMPSLTRIKDGAKAAGANRQAQGQVALADDLAVTEWLQLLDDVYKAAEETYQAGLRMGVPKELARLCVPVARYSRMRVHANLRNWLAFLTLRNAPNAQWEIRQYAICVGDLLKQYFPRTLSLWEETM